MGVTKTPNLFKALTFDGASSRNYGVYITGEAVFNAPERAVEMISIPGRNGAFALDKGHFENIEVTYPAGIFAENEADFAEAISDFRNLLCSREGYCRLTDEYNPDEYRLAIYKSGLEVSPAQLIAGEFEITFECKPQRFLTSGETKTTVASGGTLTNPTLFPSSPMLEVYGYGDIDVGGEKIKIQNVPIGEIQIAASSQGASPYALSIDVNNLNTGDSFVVSGANVKFHYRTTSTFNLNTAVTATSGCTATSLILPGATSCRISQYIDDASFVYGTSKTVTYSVNVSVVLSGQSAVSETVSGSIVYDGNHTLTFSTTGTTASGVTIGVVNEYTPDIFGNSTKSALGSPTYIDLDIGEAYMISGGSAVSLNNVISIPAELPTLPSGATTITFDNTFTKVDVVPRWWKV